jgi:hypothetical protein
MPRGRNLVGVMQSLAESVVRNAGPTAGCLDGHATGHADFVSAEFHLEKCVGCVLGFDLMMADGDGGEFFQGVVGGRGRDVAIAWRARVEGVGERRQSCRHVARRPEERVSAPVGCPGSRGRLAKSIKGEIRKLGFLGARSGKPYWGLL